MCREKEKNNRKNFDQLGRKNKNVDISMARTIMMIIKKKGSALLLSFFIGLSSDIEATKTSFVLVLYKILKFILLKIMIYFFVPHDGRRRSYGVREKELS
jgi:hypothetical protein